MLNINPRKDWTFAFRFGLLPPVSLWYYDTTSSGFLVSWPTTQQSPHRSQASQ